MNFMDYARRSERLRTDLAGPRPGLFLLVEAGRYAAVMALVIVISEATPLAFSYGSPWSRLWFIATWSAIMAGWNLWRLRARKEKAHASSPPDI